MPTFEYDPNKSAKTLADRGIDFEFAKRAWDDAAGVDVRANTEGEERWVRIAMIDGKCYTVVFTHRPPNIRIISARRSRETEEQIRGV